jgi:predicted ATPase
MENHFFKKIQFGKDFRCYKKGDLIDFKAGINLLVGEQGCGKSSLFYSIINWQESGIAADFDPNSSYLFLDTESMNPRLEESYKAHRNFKSWREDDKAKVESAIDRFALGYNEQSHGQVMLPLLLANKDVKHKTLFFDEPEAGLSIRSQYKVLEHFRKLSKNNQLIIATHSPILIQEVGEVLSLEHRKWMKADEFIELQKN